MLYGKRSAETSFSVQPAWLHTLVYRKYFIDEIYEAIIVKPLRGLGWLLEQFDRYVIDGVVRLVASSVVGLGRFSSYMQNGKLQRYALIMVFGIVILTLALVGRRLFD
jgi:NADH-quinone oxidoreductase subunit L